MQTATDNIAVADARGRLPALPNARLLAVGLGLLALALLFWALGAWGGIDLNGRAVAAELQVLGNTPTAAPRDVSAFANALLAVGHCVAYPELAADVQLIQQSDAELALNVLRQAPLCLGDDRRWLLKGQEGALLLALGRDAEAFNVLWSVRADNLIVAQAVSFEENQQWDRLARYLALLTPQRQEIGPANAVTMGTLYLTLGRQYEDAGENDAALTAYASAEDWYPATIADLVLYRSRLLARLGRRPEAEQIVIRALQTTLADPDRFVLLRELGALYVAQQQPQSAYCAYRAAQDLLDMLPQTMDPATAGTDLAGRITRLTAANPGLATVDCAALTAGWKP